MAYRNGTYIAFHANGKTEPTESDMKYYNLLKAWHVREENDFEFVNSHEKTEAVRDSSKRETLRRALVTRLRNSKNMILIIGKTTREDQDWVPFEISYAIDQCDIPIIAAYPGLGPIFQPSYLASLWPSALAQRINSEKARVIHIPFKQAVLADAVTQFDHTHPPQGSLTYYTVEAYKSFGIPIGPPI
jgi:hypothetical protein